MRLLTPDDLPPTNGYSHVAAVSGSLVWTSGQVPVAPDGTIPPAGDWDAQARQVFVNLGVALRAGGASWSDVFKLTIYVVDLSGVAAVRAARDEFIDRAAPPTSSLVQVAGLVHPDFLLEVEAVAAVAGG